MILQSLKSSKAKRCLRSYSGFIVSLMQTLRATHISVELSFFARFHIMKSIVWIFSHVSVVRLRVCYLWCFCHFVGYPQIVPDLK